MKLKTFPFVVICVVLLAASQVKAQNIHLGATTAVNATFVFDKGITDADDLYKSEFTYKVAPIGFNFGVDLGRKFGLSLESIFAKQGQVYKIIDAAEQIKGERKIDLKTLQLPMLLKFMGGGNGGARGNFNFGPQLSLIRGAVESVQAQAGTFKIPDGMDFESIQSQFPNAIDNGDNTYEIPSGGLPTTEILSKKANDFKNSEFSLAAAFGLDIDLSKHMYLTTQVRATYSLTDMRNGDLIDQLKNGQNIFGNRSSLLIGMQIGLHWSLRTTRSFKFKE